MALKMTAVYYLTSVLIAGMVLQAEANSMPSWSERRMPGLNEMDARCLNDSGAIFPQPDHCHLYFNCSDNSTVTPWFHTPHLKKCPYPQLFSTKTLRCEIFDKVTCGDRQEDLTLCFYKVALCPGFMCGKCDERFPSCEGRPDGLNSFYRGSYWSPDFSVCRSQRTVAHGRCPTHPQLEMTQLLSPVKRRCVSLYEVPKNRGGLQLNCTGKPDGLHLDDVTSRPDVYYRCFGGQFFDVYRCQSGQFFDEVTATCSSKPLYNKVMTPDTLVPNY